LLRASIGASAAIANNAGDHRRRQEDRALPRSAGRLAVTRQSQRRRRSLSTPPQTALLQFPSRPSNWHPLWRSPCLRILRVFVELIDNALKFSGRAGERRTASGGF
jgi:hypothetical protein